jgi:hypothetical protein
MDADKNLVSIRACQHWSAAPGLSGILRNPLSWLKCKLRNEPKARGEAACEGMRGDASGRETGMASGDRFGRPTAGWREMSLDQRRFQTLRLPEPKTAERFFAFFASNLCNRRADEMSLKEYKKIGN